MNLYKPDSLILAITGASGAIYGLTALKILQTLDIITHLIISKSAFITIKQELDLTPNDLYKLATYYYNNHDIGAVISSGSFKTAGMLIAPCSMNTMSSIAIGIEDTLITRAASITLKERRKLVLMTRETHLHTIHLENMLKLSKCGAIIAPPVPSFYNLPKSIDELVYYTVVRNLDLFHIDIKTHRWDGIK